MTKAEFLNTLREELTELIAPPEVDEAVAYYEEYFADAGPDQEGKVLRKLGSPKTVAAQILEDHGVEQSFPPSTRRWWKRVLLWGGGILLACGLLAGAALLLTPPEEDLADHMITAGTTGYSATLEDGFSRVEIDLPAADVTLTGIELDQAPTLQADWPCEADDLYYDVEDGTLRIWAENRDLHPEEVSVSTGSITLTVPKGLSYVRVKLERGSVSVGGLEAGSLDFHVTEGTVEVDGQSPETLAPEP